MMIGRAVLIGKRRIKGTVVDVLGVEPNRLFMVETDTGGQVQVGERELEAQDAASAPPARPATAGDAAAARALQIGWVTPEQLAQMIVDDPPFAREISAEAVIVLAHAVLAK